MAYSKEKFTITPGGMNLVPPGDRALESDSLLLLNFRPHTLGRIRSRQGISAEAAAAVGGLGHTLFFTGDRSYLGSGSRLYRNWTTQIFDGFGPADRFGMAAHRDHVWIMTRNFQGKDDGSLVTKWTIAKPPSPATVAVFGPGSLTGTVRYYVTYDNDSGHESNPSPVSADLAVTDQAVQLTNIPISGDPQSIVTKRHIYRTGGGLGQILRVLTINDNTSTSAVDDLSNDDAQAVNTNLPIDHDPPPAALGVVGPHFGRLIAFGSAQFKSRIWWTPTGRPWYFPGSGDLNAGNWIDVGGHDDPIVWVTQHRRSIVFYKQRSIWRLAGDPEQNDPEPVVDGVGLIGPRAVIGTGSVDYFATSTGVFRFDGDFVAKLSAKIQPIFDGEEKTIGPGATIKPINASTQAASAIGLHDGRLWFSYPEPGNDFGNITLIYDIATDRWMQYKTGDFGSTGFTAFGERGTDRRFIGLITIGNAATPYSLESDTTMDGSTAMLCAWQSAYLDQDLPDVDKTYSDLSITYQSGDPLTVRLFLDGGKSALAVGTLPATAESATVRFKLESAGAGVMARNISLRIDGTIDEEASISRAFIHYYPEAREGSTWDSDEQDFGAQEVKEFDKLEFDLVNQEAIEAEVRSDMPGNAMASRKGWVIPGEPGGTRRPYRVSTEATHVEGRRLRFLASSGAAAGLFRIYGARARIRRYGEYVEAYESAAGYIWESGVVDLGTDLIKEARALNLRIHADAPVNAVIETDMPGNALATRATKIAPASATERFVPLPLTGVEGRLWRLKLTSTGAYRLFGASLEVRAVGTAIGATEAADGAIWDSGEQDLGDERVKEFERLRLHVNTEGPVIADIYTDLSGEGMALRHTLTFDTGVTTSGERIIEEDLPFRTEGRLIRVVLRGAPGFPLTSEWRLFSAAVGFRGVGVYLDAGRVFRTQDSDLGDERVKLLKELQAIVDCDGVGTLRLYTELPSGEMALQHTAATPATVGRKPVKLRLPGGIQGRLIRLEFESASPCRLLTLRARVKPIGDAGGWVWVDFPITPSDQVRNFAALSVRPSPPEYSTVELPVNPTTAFQWVDMPVDALN